MNTNEAGARAQYLTFSVADEEYGLSVLSVREILEYGTVTRVPRAPAHIRGVMNLRGRVVPLVDLAVRFGLPPAPPAARTCVVVVEAEVEGERTVVGLVADGVSHVLELSPEDIEPPPPFGSTLNASFLRGMGRAGKRFVLLLDVERVLSGAPVVGLSEGDRKLRPVAASVAAALVLGAALMLAGPTPAHAQEPIKDNSFLIEEAYNQTKGVVQHINTFSRPTGGGSWLYTLTQEWPAPGQRHQLSFTLPVQQIEGSPKSHTGIGDIALNYRYQLVGMTEGPVAVSPRVTVLTHTGDHKRAMGTGGTGLQFNLPVSWDLNSKITTHWNAGFTHTFSARDEAGAKASTNGYALGQSVVWSAAPRVNFLLETVWSRSQFVTGKDRTESGDSLYVSPGIRWSHDFKNGLQIVPGLAFPIGLGPSSGDRSIFLYLSFEHPFRHNR